jgi:hypothetical protein
VGCGFISPARTPGEQDAASGTTQVLHHRQPRPRCVDRAEQPHQIGLLQVVREEGADDRVEAFRHAIALDVGLEETRFDA